MRKGLAGCGGRSSVQREHLGKHTHRTPPSCVEELGGQQRQGRVRPDVQQSSQKRAWWEGQPRHHHPEQRTCITLHSPVLRNENVGPCQRARVPQCCLSPGKPMERARREVLRGACLLHIRLGPRVSLWASKWKRRHILSSVLAGQRVTLKSLVSVPVT